MTPPVELIEYESRDVPMSQALARDIAELAGDRVGVSMGGSPGTFKVTATQYVGVLVTPGLEIVIRPKVSLENLFAMLGVGLPSHAWQRERFAFGESRDLLAALSQFFARAMNEATGIGLIRAYRREDDRLVAMRGRIDMAEQIRQPALRSTIACTFDEYTTDVIENRVLKAAARRLLRVPGVPLDARRLLKRSLIAFDEVADIEPRPDVVDRIRFTRLNEHYEPSLRLAQLVLRNLSLIDRVGTNDASAFLLDMNDLFQRYVTDRLTKELRGQLTVVSDPETKTFLGEGMRVAMYPDLVFTKKAQPVYVGDTKYKLTTTGVGKNADYYQLLAYTSSLDLPEGVLIYCQTTGAAPRKEVVVRNNGRRLVTYALQMAGSADELEQQVQLLAQWIHARTAPSVAVGVAVS